MTRVKILDKLHRRELLPFEAREQLIASGMTKDQAKAIMHGAMYGMGADRLMQVLVHDHSFSIDVIKLRRGDACRARHPITKVLDLCSVVENNGPLLWILLRERDGAKLHRYIEHVYLPETT